MAKLAFISSAHAKFTTMTAWVHGGALRAPPCTRAEVVVNFVWAREISASFATMSAWLHGCRSLLPQKPIMNLTGRDENVSEP